MGTTYQNLPFTESYETRGVVFDFPVVRREGKYQKIK